MTDGDAAETGEDATTNDTAETDGATTNDAAEAGDAIVDNVLFVSIDSLTRFFLGAYDDGDHLEFDVETENLDRFAERAATFDSHYAGSLPCMPARREWLTGTQEFLWRPWGPIEPFDRTLPLKARESGVVSALITDHFHYFQHGADGYYEDYNAFEFVRGHENDAWRTAPRRPDERVVAQTTRTVSNDEANANTDERTAEADPDDLRFLNRLQYARNVDGFEEETEYFAPKVFDRACRWLRENREWDRWFCYVDSFDVHEPFDVPEPYASMYTDEDPTDPELVTWPYYGRVDEGQSELTDRQLAFVRAQFAGKLTMVDRWFGRLLDTLDELDAWDDTAVIVTSDHGHFLGEHGFVGKPFTAPIYDVLARTPLLVWAPEDTPLGSAMGDRIGALTSAVDLHATVESLLGIDEGSPHSRSLVPLLAGETDSVRDWALYGYWGSSVNVTDGRHTYLHPCAADESVETYSTRMMNPYSWFTPEEHDADAEAGTLPYADGPVWRMRSPAYSRHDEPLLFDVDADPRQTEPLVDDRPALHEGMRNTLSEALDALDAPESQFERLGLSPRG